MTESHERQRRLIHTFLLLIIVATLPCYCAGAVLLGLARDDDAAAQITLTPGSDGQVSPSAPTATHTLPFTPTVRPSITPFATSTPPIGGTLTTPGQYNPPPTRIPTLTWTPLPTYTPILTSTPAPTLTPTFTFTPGPTSTPIIITLTPTNTFTPAPTNTPLPTATPLPTDTPPPAPTDTPPPTNTPAPTATPLPTNTPAPTSTPLPTTTDTPFPTPTPEEEGT